MASLVNECILSIVNESLPPVTVGCILVPRAHCFSEPAAPRHDKTEGSGDTGFQNPRF